MNEQIKKNIQEKAKSYLGEVVSYRRHLHKHPELSFEEHKTCAFVSETLDRFGIPHRAGVAGTGVIGLIEGKNPGKKVLALRADMDALPINEANEVEYRSVNPGVMHACGHDVHTASLLGASRILHELRGHFEGTIKLIFQPGEEKSPGGASLLIKEGVLENPSPSGIFGQHVMPLIDAGKVGFRKGMYMASTDEIYMTIKGKGGHGAFPHMNIDPVLITAHIIVALQQIVSRNARPTVPSVLSFGKVTAEGATNIIPDEVRIAGTLRTFDEKWRKEAKEKMKKMADSIAEGMGGSCEFTVEPGYPHLINDPDLTDRACGYAVEFLGRDNVQDLDLWMAGEDFSYYSHQIPGCFYRLGIRNEKKGITSSVHTATFDVDESALETGMGLMAWIAFRELGNAGIDE
jgi:amidohydrolase